MPVDYPVTWEEIHRVSKTLAAKLKDKGPFKGIVAVTPQLHIEQSRIDAFLVCLAEAAQIGLVGLSYVHMPRVLWKELEEGAVPGQRALAVVKRTQPHVQTIQGVAQATAEPQAGNVRHGQSVGKAT